MQQVFQRLHSNLGGINDEQLGLRVQHPNQPWLPTLSKPAAAESISYTCSFATTMTTRLRRPAIRIIPNLKVAVHKDQETKMNWSIPNLQHHKQEL
jgi:hypothetical protein